MVDNCLFQHPLVAHKISMLRNRDISHKQFRELMAELAVLLAVKATGDLPLVEGLKLQSPMCEYQGVELADRIGLFPVLRAGLGMVDAVLDVIPSARVYHIGLYREKSTLLPVEYYNKLPQECRVDVGIILDPMIATAGTAISTVNILKDWGLKRIKFICALASRDGLMALLAEHPDVQVYVAAIDDNLNDHGYVLPGLGDAGDRLFKTVDS
eukprot:Partr_v1_DN23581_c0_g1_i1_m14447 putative uridine kinase